MDLKVDYLTMVMMRIKGLREMKKRFRKTKAVKFSRFSEGIKAFKSAFKKIVKKNAGDEDVLGLVLSANKKLLAEKLAEEDLEKKVKGEAKKERHMISEKGHVKPAEFLDAHEKLLLGVATKGDFKIEYDSSGLHPGMDPS